jgi:hypothetical protein
MGGWVCVKRVAGGGSSRTGAAGGRWRHPGRVGDMCRRMKRGQGDWQRRCSTAVALLGCCPAPLQPLLVAAACSCLFQTAGAGLPHRQGITANPGGAPARSWPLLPVCLQVALMPCCMA